MGFPKITAFMDHIWDDEVIPVLTDYIRIPNKSPAFDPDWRAHGHMDRVVALFEDWARGKLKSWPKPKWYVARLANRTPLIFIEIPGATGNPERGGGPAGATVLMYGHLDKQPEM